MLGIHPHEAARSTRRRRRACASCSITRRAVAVGETGLDYFRDYAPRDAQRRLFERAARARRRASASRSSIHTRAADEDTRRRARRLRRHGRAPLLLVARAAPGGARPRLLRLVRRQRHLPEGVRPARRRPRRSRPTGSSPRRTPVPRAAARPRPAERAGVRRPHARGARRGARAGASRARGAIERTPPPPSACRERRSRVQGDSEADALVRGES